MRKIIFSRKGLDSSAGGAPSPIMPDGRIFSLPIPQKEKSPNRYKNLQFDEFNGTKLLKNFKSKIKPNDFCHYDPRLNQKVGIFGQANAAQSELDNLEVQTGDLFLFFGWFRNVVKKGNDLHHFLILANLVLAKTFTEIRIQVDMCHRRFLPQTTVHQHGPESLFYNGPEK